MPSLMQNSGQTGYEDIQRKQKMADLLSAMAMGKQDLSHGSPLLAAAQPIMMALAAKMAQKKADAGQEKMKETQAKDWQSIIQAMQGTPAQPAQPFVDEQAQFMGQESPQGLTATEAVPAQPGSREKMVQAMLQAQDPQLRMAGIGQMFKPKDAQWVREEGPRGTVLQRNSVTGELKQVVGQTPASVIVNAGQGPKLSSTEQKELFEADETAQASENVIGMLDEAMSINDKAYSGPAAKERAVGMSWLPGDSQAADATINLDNIMTGQALESLKAVFGGMPTEGERKILLEMQASVGKTPKQRADIITRAKKAAENRIRFNKQKADSLRKGTYRKESPVSPTPKTDSSNIEDLLKKY